MRLEAGLPQLNKSDYGEMEGMMVLMRMKLFLDYLSCWFGFVGIFIASVGGDSFTKVVRHYQWNPIRSSIRLNQKLPQVGLGKGFLYFGDILPSIPRSTT